MHNVHCTIVVFNVYTTAGRIPKNDAIVPNRSKTITNPEKHVLKNIGTIYNELIRWKKPFLELLALKKFKECF